MAAPALRPLSTGEVLDVAFGLYRSMFLPLVLVAIICRVLPDLCAVYVQSHGGVFANPGAWLLQTVLAVVMGAFGTAATTVMVAGAYLHEPVSAGEALRRAGGVLFRLVLLSFMTIVVVLAGFILFIIPGLVLFSGLLLSTVALVLEQPLSPTAAMSRSWALTGGFRGKVLLTFFVAYLLLLLPTIAIGVVAGVASLAGGQPQVLSMVLVAVLAVFVYPYLYVVITVLYYDLRVRKEGFDLELLATATQRA